LRLAHPGRPAQGQAQIKTATKPPRNIQRKKAPPAGAGSAFQGRAQQVDQFIGWLIAMIQ
jgi:hypothetical protein